MKTSHLNSHGFCTLLDHGVVAISPAIFAGESEALRLSEPVAITATHEVFGAELPDSGTP